MKQLFMQLEALKYAQHSSDMYTYNLLKQDLTFTLTRHTSVGFTTAMFHRTVRDIS